MAVCSDVADGASGYYGAVEVYDVVVAYATKAAAAVTAVDIGNGEVASLLRCRAVYYDFAYGSHFCRRLMTFTYDSTPRNVAQRMSSCAHHMRTDLVKLKGFKDLRIL